MSITEPLDSTKTIRLLTEEEWPKVFELFADSFPGKSIPLPPGASIGVIEEGGEIKAALFLTMAYHMEPAMAVSGWGHELWDLARFMEERLKEVMADGEQLTYYVTAPDSRHFLDYEKEMGRTVMHGYVPVTKTLTK